MDNNGGIYMALQNFSKINLPAHASGDFDHADIHLQSNKIFVAHTANGTIEVIDCSKNEHVCTIQNCVEASGVLCAQNKNLIFAASRGSGKILVIDAIKNTILKEIKVGPRPNGLAWDPNHELLLVADVQENNARIIDLHTYSLVNTIPLAGRPRWCIYEPKSNLFLINIREPAGVAFISSKSGKQEKFISLNRKGPHGLDIDFTTNTMFIACDDKSLVVLDISTGKEKSLIQLSGYPDVIWLNKSKKLLYCAVDEPGAVDVIDTQNYKLLDTIQTEDGAHTLTFNPKTQLLYVFFPNTCCATVYKEN